jgi:hypothetical protein
MTGVGNGGLTCGQPPDHALNGLLRPKREDLSTNPQVKPKVPGASCYLQDYLTVI